MPLSQVYLLGVSCVLIRKRLGFQYCDEEIHPLTLHLCHWLKYEKSLSACKQEHWVLTTTESSWEYTIKKFFTSYVKY